ncbi:MAG: glycosyltransferase [Bacteroidota bacterium]
MIVIAGIAVVHVIVFVLLTSVWNRIHVFRPSSLGDLKISVVVPVRNEAQNILALLDDLAHQDHQTELFEVIVVDDHSEDQTISLVKEFARVTTINLRYVSLGNAYGKKAAASLGVESATGEVILCTDGDCRVPSSWVRTYAAYFHKHEPKMVSGPVRMVGDRLFDVYQALDFSSLIVFGAATLQKGYASTCNGANMAYSKRAFLAVNGYTGNESVPSGDDEFLLQKIHDQYPGEVHFMKSKDVLVSTSPKVTVGGFIQQRLRWLSKWRLHSSLWLKVASVYAFIDFISIFFMVYGIVAGWWPWLPVVLLIALRWLAEGRYLLAASHFLEISQCKRYWPVVSFVYPFYVLLLGFGSIFGRYSWKGRSYS